MRQKAGRRRPRTPNVSYDPTREFYTEVNAAFAKKWKQQTGKDEIKINQSHGGSGKQARAVIDGLAADVVTLALAGDIDVIATRPSCCPTTGSRAADNSSPYTSTIVFVVRKGNPKGIKDWGDLVEDGVERDHARTRRPRAARAGTISPPGHGREKQFGGDQAKVLEFITKLFKNVPVLDTGARGSTTTFAQRGSAMSSSPGRTRPI